MEKIMQYKDLKEIDYNDEFFDSLREDYHNFNEWFKTKQNEDRKAYVTYYNNNKISSFLLLKLEDENENYNDFDKPFTKGYRLKICTIKVDDTNKNIGKSFMKIINEYALKFNVDEIYITVNKKYIELKEFLKKYNFNYYGTKNTIEGKGDLIKEEIYVKRSKHYE